MFYDLNFNLEEAPINIKEDIANGKLYQLIDGEYIRDVEKEEEIKQINDINNLQQQINNLKKINQDQQNIINAYLVRLVQESTEFNAIEKEALWSLIDKFDEATQKEIELNKFMYSDEQNLENWLIDKDYKTGDKFIYENKIYKVIQDHKSFSNWLPNLVHSVYTVIGLKEQATEIKDWVQPTGSHNDYNIGDKVKFDSKIYESLINNNTWSPSVYPQGWKLIN
jgi:hypothetical protein